MDSDDACPPTPVEVLGDADSSLSDHNKDEPGGKHTGNDLLGKPNPEVECDISAAAELPQSLGERSAAGVDMPSGPGPPRGASPAAEPAEGDQQVNLASPIDPLSVGEEAVNEMREEAAADLEADSKLDAGEVRDLPAWLGLVWKLPCLFLLPCKALLQQSSWSTYVSSVKAA